METLNGGATRPELGVLRELLEGILPGCAPEPLTPGIELHGDLGLDSLDLVDLTAGIEDRFGVAIDADERGRLRTVADLLEHIARRD